MILLAFIHRFLFTIESLYYPSLHALSLDSTFTLIPIINSSTLWSYAASRVQQRPKRLKKIPKSENQPERKWGTNVPGVFKEASM
jgi:hypothetical protein